MTISYSGNFFKLLLRWKGSIWRSTWKELIIYLALYYAIRIFYKEGIDVLFDARDRPKIKEQFRTLCLQFNEYTKLIPLTFLLGFYVSNVVSRWWRQFETLSWPEDIISLLCLVIPKDDEKSQRRRHVIARYLNLTSALAWRDVSSKIRLRFPKVRDLITAGLLTDKEYIILEEHYATCPAIRWMAPLHWVQQILQDEVKDNNPTTSLVNNFVTELKLYRQSFRKLFSYDWVCVPLVYTQVAALATYAFFFFCLFGRQFLDGDSKTFDLKIPFFLIVQFLFFVGWFKVGQDLMRPFGLDDDDIELNWILDRNITTSFAMVHQMMETTYPEIGEGNEDIFWKSRDKPPTVSQTGLIDKIKPHTPKLHAYVRMPNSETSDDEKAITCSRLRGDQPKLSW
ncbi:unnamed protein product, partial [Mesorhabditis belari]|uniref:Bestrophin homolog n=1 Tax=Mesorhabditis belari TaxID=2138241 RepID=A0AAF3FH81_9BILA